MEAPARPSPPPACQPAPRPPPCGASTRRPARWAAPPGPLRAGRSRRPPGEATAAALRPRCPGRLRGRAALAARRRSHMPARWVQQAAWADRSPLWGCIHPPAFTLPTPCTRLGPAGLAAGWEAEGGSHSSCSPAVHSCNSSDMAAPFGGAELVRRGRTAWRGGWEGARPEQEADGKGAFESWRCSQWPRHLQSADEPPVATPG